jgi:hypothetical protein
MDRSPTRRSTGVIVSLTSGKARVLVAVLAVSSVWALSTSVERQAQASGASSTSAWQASVWPAGLFAADESGTAMGAPERLTIPTDGDSWVSPGPVTRSGFVTAWAKLSHDKAATAIGAVSADGTNWTEVMRASANANRSMPHVNLVLPVPEGFHFRLTLEGARGGGLEIVEDSGAHFFPLSVSTPGS